MDQYKVLDEKVIQSPNSNKHQLIDSTVQVPNGKKVIWQYIETRDVVTIVALDSKNRIYCVRQWRPARKDYVWELPAGGITVENPTTTQVLEHANRELQEEVGLKADKLELLASFTPSIHMTSKFYVVLAKDLSPGKLSQDDDEDLEIKALPFNEAFELLVSKQIPSAMTLVGMLMLRQKTS